jgi:hypothetical protein
MIALPPTSRITSFLFIIIFSLVSKFKQGSFLSNAQAQGIEVEDSLCVEFNKVKFKVIEAHNIFVLY